MPQRWVAEAPENPVIFIKPNTSIIGPQVPILRPKSSDRVDYEGELAVVIGRPCRDVKAAAAKDVILGYTIGNDVTARDQQKADGQWTRGKGHDTFCPLGPWIETELDPADLEIRTELNGEVKQRSRTSLMLHDIGEIVEWISAVMTLLPGDVILTGTPEGIGPMVAGDTVECHRRRPRHVDQSGRRSAASGCVRAENSSGQRDLAQLRGLRIWSTGGHGDGQRQPGPGLESPSATGAGQGGLTASSPSTIVGSPRRVNVPRDSPSTTWSPTPPH